MDPDQSGKRKALRPCERCEEAERAQVAAAREVEHLRSRLALEQARWMMRSFRVMRPLAHYSFPQSARGLAGYWLTRPLMWLLLALGAVQEE